MAVSDTVIAEDKNLAVSDAVIAEDFMYNKI
jgi:hypothetical protein